MDKVGVEGHTPILTHMSLSIALSDSAYFDTPEEIRLAYSVLKSADILPQEAEPLKEIAALRKEAAAAKDSARRARLLDAVDEKRLQFNMMMERQRRLSKS